MTALGALRYRFRLEGADVAWELLEATLDEALHEVPTYCFEVLHEPDEAFASLLGKSLGFELERHGDDGPQGEALRRVGIVVAEERLGTVFGRHRLRLTAASRAYELGLGRHHRIWQARKASEVISELLHDAGLQASVAATARPRPMCTQYGESVLDFVRRLCEEEGQTLLVEVAREGTLSTVNAGRGDVFADLGTIDFVSLDAAASRDAECVYDLAHERRLGPREVRASDWDRHAAVQLSARRSLRGTTASTLGAATVELLAASAGSEPSAPGTTNAATFEAESAPNAHDLRRGTGNVRAFTAGRRFTLAGAEGGDLELLLTRVQHRVSLRASASEAEGGHGVVYQNTFEGAPAARAFRPSRLTPRPVIPAPQTAIVVGFPSRPGTSVTCEVQVRFFWPEAGRAATAWVRVAQLLAGNGWGAQFLPREGDEVVVQFLNGDPDRPLVTGAVYNGVTELPAAIPAHHSRSAIRTASWGDAGANEVYWEDAADAEVLGLVASRDHRVEVKHDATEAVGHDRTATVGKNDTLTVKQDQSVTVEGHRKATVKGTEKVTIERAQELLVKATQKVTVFDKSTLSADGGIVLQCGDTRVEITPTGVSISNGAGLGIKMDMGTLKLEHPQAGTVTLGGAGVSVQSKGGAKVELVGPVVNLN